MLGNGGGRQEGKRTSQSSRKTKCKNEKERTRQGRTAAAQRIALEEDIKTEKNSETPRERGRPEQDKGIRKRKVACEKNT